MIDNTLLAYFGHHRCATAWTSEIMANVCKHTDRKFVYLHNPAGFNRDLKRFVKENDVDFLFYANADFKYVKNLDDFRGFHMIRDPRDIVVSAYFSHLYSHPTEDWPELIEYREKLQAVSKDEGLFLEIAFSEWAFQHLYNWNYSQPNVFEIKMEHMIQNPYQVFLEISEFLELVGETNPSSKTSGNISKKKLWAIIHYYGFSKRAAGRRLGEEDKKSHFRKGVAGDWVNHFNDDHIMHFKKNYNDLLVKLGYESGYNWRLDGFSTGKQDL